MICDLFGHNSLPLQRFVSIAATSDFNFKHPSVWEDLKDYIDGKRTVCCKNT